MDWTQTLTIISSMVAVWYAFYHIIKEDIKRHDVEISEMRQEFSEVHALWASLLKEISDIKLDQSKKA